MTQSRQVSKTRQEGLTLASIHQIAANSGVLGNPLPSALTLRMIYYPRILRIPQFLDRVEVTVRYEQSLGVAREEEEAALCRRRT